MSPTFGTEEISWEYYDSKTPGAGDVSAILFQDPLGSGGKTLYDTNMTTSGCLPSPQRMKVHLLRVAMLPDALIADVLAMMKGVIRVFVGHRAFYPAPLFWMSGGGGLALAQEEAGVGTFGYGAFGFPSAENLHVLSTPIEIGESESFRVELNWPVSPGVKKVYVFLGGLLTRATQ